MSEIEFRKKTLFEDFNRIAQEFTYEMQNSHNISDFRDISPQTHESFDIS